MSRIFVSYRREDNPGTVGRICDRLKDHFGDDSIFFDIDRPSGTDYTKDIASELSKIDVMVAVIGPKWTGETRQKKLLGLISWTSRRIDDPLDWVRVEVETALSTGIPVIPTYLGRTPRLDRKSLPQSLEKFVLRNDTYIDDGVEFEGQMERLIRSIDQHLGGRSMEGSGRKRRANARGKGANDHVTGLLDNYVIRFGNGADVIGINLIARQWFPDHLILSRQEISRWLKSDRGIFRVAAKINENGIEEQVVGYYGIFPISLALYEKLKTHEVDEKSIRLEDFHDPFSPATEAIYVLDVARHKEEEVVGKALLRDLGRYIGKIVRNNPNVKKIGTWAFTKDGQTNAARLGLDRIKDYDDETSFYEIDNPTEYLFGSSPPKLVQEFLKSEFQETHNIVI